MREIVLDTETTGLDPASGHRIVEIGCLELINHVPTDNTFHTYINPQRPMPQEAYAVHGLSDEFLSAQPVFADICQDFLGFITDSALVIHNARFDLGFLNAELALVGTERLLASRAVDTLMLARAKFPGSPNSLDALCRRFEIDTSLRDKHGALVDSHLLAKVYLELIGGAQPGFDLTDAGAEQSDLRDKLAQAAAGLAVPRPRACASRLTQEEARAHREFVDTQLGGAALWRRWREESAS